MLPAGFINSHLDSCLTGGGSGARAGGGAQAYGARKSSGGSGGAKPAASSGGGAKLSSGGGAKPGGGAIGGVNSGGAKAPLKVPPKLCVALMTDKQMRDTCRKFGLPCIGKKDVSCVFPPTVTPYSVRHVTNIVHRQQ